MESPTCEVCNAAEETTAHILFGCPHAAQFWTALQIPTEQQWPTQALKGIQPPVDIPRKHFWYLPSVMLLAHLEETQQCGLEE